MPPVIICESLVSLWTIGLNLRDPLPVLLFLDGGDSLAVDVCFALEFILGLR